LGEKEDLKMILQILCENSEGQQEIALEFTSNFELVLNATFSDFVFKFQIEDA